MKLNTYTVVTESKTDQLTATVKALDTKDAVKRAQELLDTKRSMKVTKVVEG